MTAINRRLFLKTGATAGGGLLLMLAIPPTRETKSRARFHPSVWLEIEPDGQVILTVDRSEMGQGARTSLAMILADELGADWRSVRIEHAMPGPAFRDMRTSGSSSVSDRWSLLRQAAAAARALLVQAASERWNVRTSECEAAGGAVTHRASGRKLAFGDLAGAAAALAPRESAPLKSVADLSIVGSRIGHVDALAIVTGRAVYGIDASAPGMKFAAVERCPVLGGTPKTFDASRARGIPGFRDAFPISTGIAVVADSSWVALKARSALRIDWIEGKNARDDSEAYWRQLELAIARGGRVTRSLGDSRAAISSAHRKLEATYRYSFQTHAAIEPLNCVASVTRDGCEIWAATQAPNQAQEEAARVLGIDKDAVRLHVTLLGGGFGRRLGVDFVAEAVEISRAARVPIKLLWTREDDTRHGMYNPAAIHEFSAGLDASGRPVAWNHRSSTFHLTMFGKFDANNPDTYDGGPWGGPDQPYDFPAMRVEYAPTESPVPTGAWRSVEYPATVFGRESFLDEIARAAGVDPLDLRLSLLPSPGLKKVGSSTLPNGDRLRHVLDIAAAKAGWRQPFARERGGRRFGRGIACNPYHSRTMVAQVAEVSVGDRGDVRVHRVVCAIDCGVPVNPAGIEAQVEGGIAWGLSAALKTEITFRSGRVEQGSFDDLPILGMDEMPAVETTIVPSELGPFGVGEQPVPPAMAAVANAIFDAAGTRVRSLPIRMPEALG